MTSSSEGIPQIKLELKNVIENLKIFENTSLLDNQQLEDLKIKTEQLLTNLEHKPLENIKKSLKKRQKSRKHKKLKQKLLQPKKQDWLNEDIKPETHGAESLKSRIQTSTLERSTKYHHHLKSISECQRFLKTFELLEQLHLARGQDPNKTRKFASKLQHLRLIWNSLLQEKQSESSNTEQKVQEQWNRVFFGKTEKTFFEGKVNQNYFIRKRHIWDSYIDNKYGTSIPIGWVLPPTTPTNEWSQYLQ
ncbi:uncharacterized protein LOC106088978 [Stomoxys calcitrans]|uniref:Uncharacterized protein n=1 Tax=Stomoxys calcitrans TaxID=35570 RepID=A0A1I8P8W6_STOCA|nr:uncharacterized protein LOC106088978 [Stomoxys calcitrans]